MHIPVHIGAVAVDLLKNNKHYNKCHLLRRITSDCFFWFASLPRRRLTHSSFSDSDKLRRVYRPPSNISNLNVNGRIATIQFGMNSLLKLIIRTIFVRNNI